MMNIQYSFHDESTTKSESQNKDTYRVEYQQSTDNTQIDKVGTT